MASRILHLAVLEEMMKKITVSDKNRFRLGCILPDAYNPAVPKSDSHLKISVCGKSKKTYDLDRFLSLFEQEMKADELYKGYYLHLIQDLINFARSENVRDRFIFVEDYDITLARHLVQGVDVWLNTPRRPMEASGTSGMKAAVNGALNCSILDGWWDEAYEPANGWAIPGNHNFSSEDDIDNFESQSLFHVLENEIIPCFYERVGGDVPARWVKKMKASIAMAISKFSSWRMVKDYNEMFYSKAQALYDDLIADNGRRALEIVNQKRRLAAHFYNIYVHEPVVGCDMNKLHVGEKFKVSLKVYLGEMSPDEVKVEVYYGHVDNRNAITQSFSVPMQKISAVGDGNYMYEAEVICKSSGRFGITARVTPAGNDWQNSVPGFMAWPK